MYGIQDLVRHATYFCRYFLKPVLQFWVPGNFELVVLAHTSPNSTLSLPTLS